MRCSQVMRKAVCRGRGSFFGRVVVFSQVVSQAFMYREDLLPLEVRDRRRRQAQKKSTTFIGTIPYPVDASFPWYRVRPWSQFLLVSFPSHFLHSVDFIVESSNLNSPCMHDGPCTKENNCPCDESGAHCTSRCLCENNCTSCVTSILLLKALL